MGKDCDLRDSRYCFNRITWNLRFFIKIPDKYERDNEIEYDYNRRLLAKHFSGIEEGICIECFLKLINSNNEINTSVLHEIRKLYPDFSDTDEISWYAIYHSIPVDKDAAIRILNIYREDRRDIEEKSTSTLGNLEMIICSEEIINN